MKTVKKTNLKKNPIKILLMGLENSGKTSILLSLEKNTNLLSYCSLKPTAGINIVNLEDSDTQFSIWDFGGQAKYRTDYLENFDKHITGVDKIIFVLDVQDIERYELALQYLKDIIDRIKIKDRNIDFSVFLHKFDPNIEKLDQFTDKEISLKLINRIKSLIPGGSNYKIFKTTIYTVFHKQLIT